MSWDAIDSLGDARAATSELLLPFDLGTWLRLALVVVFVGTGAGNASVNANVGGTASGAPTWGSWDLPSDDLPPIDPDAILGEVTLLSVAAVAGVALLLALGFALVGATMQFVLVTALADRTVRVRGPFADHFGRGVRLFGFQLGVVLLALLVVAVPVGVVLLGGVAVGPAVLLAALPILLLGVGLALLVALVFRLTVDFVVPTMLAADCGVLDGWRRLAPTLRAEWEEFALYLLIRVSLGVLVGTVFAAGTLFVAVLVALPFVVLGGAVFFAFSAAGPLPLLGWALLGVVGLLYLVAVAVAGAFLLVPVVTFLRYYALSVLGRLDAGLDLVGAATRGTDDDGGEGGVGGRPVP